MPDVLTRRQLLRRGGILAGAMTLGSLAGSPVAGAQTPTARIALDPARRQSFTALAETVLTGPSFRLPASAAQSAASDFAAAYVTWPAADRRRADRVLDQLEKLDRKGRERALKPPGLERRELEVAEQALALVALVTAPSDGLDVPVVTL